MNLVPLVLVLLLAAATPNTAALLRWSELLETVADAALGGSAAHLTLGARLKVLEGKPVRIVGYMAQLEDGPRGAFYLASRPVSGDESGGGSADLPPDAIRVAVRSLASAEVPYVPGPIEVIGVLQLGTEVDEEGRVSRVRIVLDAAPPHAARTR